MKFSALGKNLLALTLGVALLAVVEGTLAFLGVTPLSGDDRFAGFSGSSPVFLPHPQGNHTRHELNPAKERYFNTPQSFQMPKPPGTFRIVSFGGSTTYGRPYINSTSFPTWLSKLLGNLDPGTRYESINLGGISYASYRVRRLAQEAAGYQPDLFVVYSGHNEFLEARTFEKIIEEPQALRRARQALHHSRLYSALYRGAQQFRGRPSGPRRWEPGQEVAARLEEIGGPELYHRDLTFRTGVIQQYRESIAAIVRDARGRGIPVILCTLPSNLAGVSPFKSEHRSSLSSTERAEWDRLLASATNASLSGQPENTLALLDCAIALDDSHAAAHFARGNVLLQLDRPEEAYTAFLRAKEEDIIPLRALDAFNEAVREVAQREGVPLADVETRFRAETPDGIPGPDLFVDHVHPTIKGQQLIAWVVLETATRAGVVPVTEAMRAAREEQSMLLLGAEYRKITPRYRAMGLWGVGRLFHWAGKYREAYAPLLEAWQMVKDVEEIPRLLGEIEVSLDRPQDAVSFFREALAIQPASAPSLTGLAKAHLAAGDAESALAALDQLALGAPVSPVTMLLRGEAAVLRGRFEEALPLLEEAYRREPNVMRFPFSLARAYALSGDAARGKAAFAHYLKLAGEPWSEEAYAALRAGDSR